MEDLPPPEKKNCDFILERGNSWLPLSSRGQQHVLNTHSMGGTVCWANGKDGLTDDSGGADGLWELQKDFSLLGGGQYNPWQEGGDGGGGGWAGECLLGVQSTTYQDAQQCEWLRVWTLSWSPHTDANSVTLCVQAQMLEITKNTQW